MTKSSTIKNNLALPARTAKILKMAVKEYISRGLPVASEDLYAKYNFDIKPATIRAELSRLADEGYLTQLHTSGGRVPTEKGYQFFVERIQEAIFGSSDGADQAFYGWPTGWRQFSENFNLGDLGSLVGQFSQELKLLSFGYEEAGQGVYKKGLRELCERLIFSNADELTEVVRDFEELDNSAARLFDLLENEDQPSVFIGSQSPITTSQQLAVIADCYNWNGEERILAVVGPVRMDYAKPLKLMRAVKMKSKAKKYGRTK